MKHVIDAQSKWAFGAEPFEAFRCQLVFGRNKRDFKMIPCKAATGGDGLLPEGGFKVIKTKAKGTIMIVPGTDSSDRVLWMGGVNDGFRGSSKILMTHTTATILHVVQACSAVAGRTEVAAILSPGEQIAFHSIGRRTDEVRVVACGDGGVLVSRIYQRPEWEAINQSDEAEVI